MRGIERERREPPALEAPIGERRVALPGRESGEWTRLDHRAQSRAARTQLRHPPGRLVVGGAEEELVAALFQRIETADSFVFALAPPRLSACWMSADVKRERWGLRRQA